MHEYIQLQPCPFCGGPPVLHHNTPLPDVTFECYVFCHECGAQSGEQEAYCDDNDAVEKAIALMKAILAWNQRDLRHFDLVEFDLCQVRICEATAKVYRARDDAEKLEKAAI